MEPPAPDQDTQAKGGSPVFRRRADSASIAHTLTRPYRPQTNGKVECCNRTLLNEWAYARPYRSEAARTRALASGSTCTTIIGTTPPSVVHPSADSTMWLGRTPRARTSPEGLLGGVLYLWIAGLVDWSVACLTTCTLPPCF